MPGIGQEETVLLQADNSLGVQFVQLCLYSALCTNFSLNTQTSVYFCKLSTVYGNSNLHYNISFSHDF